MKNRTLTLVVQVTDAEQAKWIWNNHMGENSHGVRVDVIAEGNEIENLEAELDKLYVKLGDR